MERTVLQAWLEEGRSLEWIAEQIGRHPSTVSYWLRHHGLAAAHRERHLARGGLDDDLLADLVDEGLSIAQIAARVDRSATTVRHWLTFYGLRTQRARERASIDARAGADDRRCPRHGPTRWTERGGRQRCARCCSEAVTRRRREVKRLLVAEAGGACVVCGYARHVGALQFHHVDPAQKTFHLGLKGLTRALDTVREEARKCVLLCANCHAEVEAGVTAVPASALQHIRG